MDSHAPFFADDEADELDLVGYPAERGRSLLDVAVAGMAGGFSGWNRAARSLPIVGLAVVGLALGAGLGLALV